MAGTSGLTSEKVVFILQHIFKVQVPSLSRPPGNAVVHKCSGLPEVFFFFFLVFVLFFRLRCKEGLVLALDPTDPGDMMPLLNDVLSKSFRNRVGVRRLWDNQVWGLNCKAERLLPCSHRVRNTKLNTKASATIGSTHSLCICAVDDCCLREAKNDCTALEDLLTKGTKMFHPSHYIPTLTR